MNFIHQNSILINSYYVKLATHILFLQKKYRYFCVFVTRTTDTYV